MSRFQLGEFKINTEQELGDNRVMKFEEGVAPKVENFKLPALGAGEKAKYSVAAQKFGNTTGGQNENSTRSQKDSRFSLSHLVRANLSVEEEERRQLETKVAERVAVLAEGVKAKAAEQGYEEGVRKGQKEAYRKFQVDSNARMARLDALLGEIEHAKEEIFQANERFLMEVIFRIGKMVLLKELTTDRGFLLRLVRELINRVGIRDNILLKIGTADAETISELKGGLEKTFGPLKNLNIEVSPQVNSGGCMLETEWNAIDASIDTQLNGLYEGLLGNNHGVSNNSNSGSGGSGSAPASSSNEGVGA